MIRLSKHAGSLNAQIYNGLLDAMASGRLSAGERLPPTRVLAEELGVSRRVVVLAYERLLAAGYVEARGGSGTYVTTGLLHQKAPATEDSFEPRISRFAEVAAKHIGPLISQKRKPKSQYDFSIGRSDLELFPFQTWRRMLMRYATSASVRAYDYSSPAGSTALRDAIAWHLRRSRGVHCEPSQVIIVSGAQQALDLTARVLLNPKDRVVLEDPQYLGAREVFRAAAADLCPVPVDAEGLRTSELPTQAELVVVTPSHQFPTGAIMSPTRRLELLEWARRSNAFILEDDYDGEFRYDNNQREALQGLDRDGRVVYIGSFSRTMFSSMRIGYVVLPRSLVLPFTSAKWLADRHTATLEQETLAEFIRNGMYERHLRRVRLKNAHKRGVLLEAISASIPSDCRVSGDHSGEHVVLWLPAQVSEAEVVAHADTLGVSVSGLSRHFLTSERPPGLLLGYIRLSDAQILAGINLLGRAIRGA